MQSVKERILALKKEKNANMSEPVAMMFDWMVSATASASIPSLEMETNVTMPQIMKMENKKLFIDFLREAQSE